MNLQQLRYVHEFDRCGLNVSEAAEALLTSQPGVSTQIRQFEAELGVEIFVRHGKRLIDVTEPGRQVLAIAERMLRDMDNLRQVGDEFSREAVGWLSIATTHTQARYALPAVIKAFVARYPGVKLELHQGNPRQVCEMALAGEADLAIATEAIGDYSRPRHAAVLPMEPLHRRDPAPPHPGRTALDTGGDRALPAHHLRRRLHRPQPDQQGLPRPRAEAQCGAHRDRFRRDQDLRGDGSGHRHPRAHGLRPRRGQAPRHGGCVAPVESSTTRIGLRRNAYLRGYVYDFIERFAPHLNRCMVDIALAGKGEDYAL